MHAITTVPSRFLHALVQRAQAMPPLRMAGLVVLTALASLLCLPGGDRPQVRPAPATTQQMPTANAAATPDTVLVHPTLGLKATVTGEGLSIADAHIAVAAWGRTSGPRTEAQIGTVSASPERATIDRPGLQEVVSLTAAGIRHDVVISDRPSGSGEVVVEITCREGTFVAKDERGAEIIIGSQRLTYDRLKVVDADNQELVARMSVVAGRVQIAYADEHARYPVLVDPTIAGIAATYTVTYFGNGTFTGTVPPTQTKSAGVTLTIFGNTGSLARPGYQFSDWNTAANGTGTSYAPGASYAPDASIDLYAQWTPTYIVAFDANGATSGTAPANQTKVQGISLALSGNSGTLAKTGSTFTGWNTASNGTGTAYQPADAYTTNAAVTLYAQWLLNTYQVSYGSNGATSGTAPAAQTKTYGINLTITGNTGLLAKSGSTFTGWNTAANGTGFAYQPGDAYTTNAAVTLYAQWLLDTFTVSYDANGATSGSAPSNQLKTYGVNLALAGGGGMAQTGATFGGWNTAANGSGTPYAAGATFATNATTTVYAQWMPNRHVTFNPNGAISGTVPSDQTKYFAVSLSISGNTGGLTTTGMVFYAWNTAANGTGTTYFAGAAYTAEADLTLYATYALSYAIVYDGNGATGGSVPASQTKVWGINLTLSGNSGALTKTGSAFAGWNTIANGSGTPYAPGATYTANAATTLFAQWVPVYIVSYDANGATSGTIPADQAKIQGVSLTLASNSGALAKTGMGFAGWNTAANGTGTAYLVLGAYATDAAITLYAQWVPAYTVSFDANSATSGSVPANQIKIQGISLALSGNTGSLAKTGATFTGWNTSADGTGTAYAAGATYTTNAAVTLYAQWVLATYPVSFDANGATSGTAPANQIKTSGQDLTLVGNSGALAKTGSTFAGWNTAANGTGTAYAAGATYTANVAATLYAQWTLGGGSVTPVPVDTPLAAASSSSSSGGGGCGMGSGIAILLSLGLALLATSQRSRMRAR